MVNRKPRDIPQSELFYRALFEQASDGIFFYDRQGNVISFNESFARMHGYSKEEMVAMGVNDMDLQGVIHAPDQYCRLMSGETVTFEAEHSHKSGYLFHLEVTANLITVGKEQLIVAIHRDITARVRTEEALRKNEAKMRAMVESIVDVIAVVDKNGLIRYISPNVDRWFNWRPEDLVGSLAWDNIHPEDAADTLLLFEGLLSEASGNVSAECRYRSRDGIYKWIEYTLINRLLDPDISGVLLCYHDITDRKLASQLISRSERLLLESQQAAHIGSYATDLQSRTWQASPQIFEIFGIDESYPRTLAGWAGFIHPDSREELIAYHLQVEAERRRFDRVYKIVRINDGVERWVHGLGEFEYDAEHNPVRLIGTIQDVTERMLVEIDLVASEARYRRITEGLTDYQYMVRVKNGAAVETTHNPACVAVTGYRPEEFAADPYLWITIVVPEERDSVRAQVARILAGEHVPPIVHRIIRKDGAIRWISDTTILFKNAAGDLLSYDGVIKDITGLKNAEDEIAASELKYRTLFQSMQNGFALHEVICGDTGVPLDYRFIEVNEAFERLTGLQSADITGRTVSQVLPGLEPVWVEVCGGVALSGQPAHFESFSEKLQKYFEVTVYSPQPRLFTTIIADITARKVAERELKEKNDELERFSYTVSHDLKSPLITIQTYAGMTRRDLAAGTTTRVQDDLQRIEAAAGKMTDLLNDLLRLSQAGKAMNAPARIDMNRLVRETLVQLAGPLDEKGITVLLREPLGEAFGDRKRIGEVIQNLVENAVKYRGDQPALLIEIGTKQDGRDTVFYVRDNGKGVEPCFQEKIFGLFNKLDARSPGTGVGLALVKRSVEVHGGRVWVESQGRGHGSTFCFTLPMN